MKKIMIGEEMEGWDGCDLVHPHVSFHIRVMVPRVESH